MSDVKISAGCKIGHVILWDVYKFELNIATSARINQSIQQRGL